MLIRFDSFASCHCVGYVGRTVILNVNITERSCGDNRAEIISELFDTTWLVSDVRLSENDDSATQRPGGTARLAPLWLCIPSRLPPPAIGVCGRPRSKLGGEVQG